MKIYPLNSLGRGDRHLRAGDACPGDGEGEEEVGVRTGVMITEVVGAGAEVVHVHHPAFYRDGDTDIALLVALAAQGEKADSFRIENCLLQLVSDGIERRSLIKAAVGGA